MQNVVGVRFKQAGKIYYFSPGSLKLAQDDDVIVETSRGVEYGLIVIGPRDVEDSAVVLPLKTVQRKATKADRAKVVENERKEKDAFRICEKKIAAHKLPMKLVEVEYTFDVNKIIFYFTADGRIDFRELVKDLAAVFRTRIEAAIESSGSTPTEPPAWVQQILGSVSAAQEAADDRRNLAGTPLQTRPPDA